MSSKFPSELVLPQQVTFTNAASSPVRRIYEQSLKREQSERRQRRESEQRGDSAVNVERQEIDVEEDDNEGEFTNNDETDNNMKFFEEDGDDDDDENNSNDGDANNTFFGKPSAALTNLLEEVEYDNENVVKSKNISASSPNNKNQHFSGLDDQDEESESRERHRELEKNVPREYVHIHNKLVPNAVFGNSLNSNNNNGSKDASAASLKQQQQIPQLAQYMMISEDQQQEDASSKSRGGFVGESGSGFGLAASKNRFKGLQDRKAGMLNFLQDLIESSERAGNFLQQINKSSEDCTKMGFVHRKLRENKPISKKTKMEARMECVKALSLFYGL